MCLIIASPTGQLPPDEHITNGFANNDDGWGIAWSDGSTIQVAKGFAVSELEETLPRISGYPYILHFRWATHGAHNRENLHPFKIYRGLYMAHNGVLDIDCTNTRMSDTWHFARSLRSSLKGSGEALQDSDYLKELGGSIGAGNKLAFIDARGRIPIVNRLWGEHIEGLWYSNEYSLYEPYPEYSWKPAHRTALEESFISGFARLKVLHECAFCDALTAKAGMVVIDHDIYICQSCAGIAEQFYPEEYIDYGTTRAFSRGCEECPV